MTKEGYAALIMLLVACGWLYVRYRQAEGQALAYEHGVMTPENYIEYVAAQALREGRLVPVAEEKGLSLLVVLDERGCATCIAVEMEYLNQYWTDLNAIIRVVYAGEGIYLQREDIDFTYEQVPNVGGVFGRLLEPVNPLTLLFMDGRLVDVRLADPTVPYYEEYTRAWYEGIRTLWVHVQTSS
ncbi:hypothetical protein [Rhodocaloribacter sp.]